MTASRTSSSCHVCCFDRLPVVRQSSASCVVSALFLASALSGHLTEELQIVWRAAAINRLTAVVGVSTVKHRKEVEECAKKLRPSPGTSGLPVSFPLALHAHTHKALEKGSADEPGIRKRDN